MPFELVELQINCQGWLISTCTVKVHILVFRLLFPVIPCISDRNLIILLKFNAKLTLIKDRSFPPPQNPPLVHRSAVLIDYYVILTWSWLDLIDLSDSFDWMDLLLDCYTICTHFFCIYLCPVLAWCKVECLVFTIVLKHVEALSCFQCLISYPIIWITF